eukprot:TRINITY_DN7837_c0_g1_i1.p1 TRINITY_DN7837_c0_g1~~TRINITY_DN7837_c0_g1_i1.p1  ORF type:complete len:432 (+),score=82.10 TRINITY_DN7837_c0_g1_i1:235-1530(+)
MEGANTDCGQPICCRKEAGMGAAGKQAQKFGDWACDLAPAMADSMFEAIGALETVPDFVINTGDDPAHDVWAQTKDANLAAVNYVANAQLNMSFGKQRPIVNVFGNHEPVPVNQYRGPGHDDWLYSGAAKAWSTWLPTDATRTLEYGGFYQMRLTEKLRAVVMHSTMFMASKLGGSGNWFFSVNKTDMAEQFPWLTDTLQQARERGEKVLLMHHCSKHGFSDEFGPLIMNITDAYQDVIVASLAGHSHTTWLSVLMDRATHTKPVDVTYVSGSGTPGGGSPTFRVFHYDLETYEIVDYDQYWVDMDKANQDGKAVWVKDHSAKEYYGLTDLSGQSWTDMATSMLHGNDNMTLWQNYARALTRGRPNHAKRTKEACVILCEDKTNLKTCMNDTTAEFDNEDDTHGSFVPLEMGQWVVGAAETTQKQSFGSQV